MGKAIAIRRSRLGGSPSSWDRRGQQLPLAPIRRPVAFGAGRWYVIAREPILEIPGSMRARSPQEDFSCSDWPCRYSPACA